MKGLLGGVGGPICSVTVHVQGLRCCHKEHGRCACTLVKFALVKQAASENEPDDHGRKEARVEVPQLRKMETVCDRNEIPADTAINLGEKGLHTQDSTAPYARQQ